MGFSSTLKLDSKIFNRAEVLRAVSNLVVRQAKEFKLSTRDKMENSPHTGKQVSVRGSNFRATKQRSKRGERPQKQTGVLSAAVVDRRVGELSAVVEIDETRAPYGRILVEELDRVVMSADDASEAEAEMQRRGNEIIRNLL